MIIQKTYIRLVRTIMIVLSVLMETLLASNQAVATFRDQVYPSEYAYHSNSVSRIERPTANCRAYPTNGQGAEHYTHCDGSQLRLTDSDLGSQQYNSSDYYVWSAGSSSRLLFIIPTRVNLTTITLHYYSDNAQGLPKLRFYAVPDDFNIWDALIPSYSYVAVAAVPPSGEPAGRRNVSINVNFTTKILMYKYSSSFAFAVSEVEFFTCQFYTETTTSVITPEVDRSSAEWQPKTATSTIAMRGPSTISSIKVIAKATSTTDQPVPANQGSTTVAWILFAMMTVLFIVSLTVNVIMVALWVYKKREVKGQKGQRSEFEIEGNPCYEATQMKQTTETETHLYETVKGKRGK